MGREPLIYVREADLGSHPEAFSLNASFRKDLPILKLRVEVEWEPQSSDAALTSLEAGLLEVCPSLRDHQCRGDETYHVLRSVDGKQGRDEEAGRAIEAPLVLTHLFEHVVIDAISFITDEPVISGATAALRGSLNEFDVFVGTRGSSERIPYTADAGATYPQWSYVIEGGTIWKPETTLRITVHYETAVTSGTHIVQVVTPTGTTAFRSVGL